MKPLDDIRVLDLTRVVSGPFCTMLLGDMGADIIKIEEPKAGDDSRAFGPPFVAGEAAYFLSVNRGKRSVALDLKHPDTRPALRALVEASDIFIENFRPGTADRLGLGYAALSEWNSRIIYCSISGFGQDGPERDRPGYDLVVQGESGIMGITGEADGPPMKVGTAIADLVTGLYATQGILLALRARERTGKGQRVDVAMVDAMASLLTFNAGIYFASGHSPSRRGNAHPTIVPYETFQTTDGWINIAVANDSLWRRFCDGCVRADLKDDLRFATAPARVQNRVILIPILQEMIATQSRLYWVKRLDDAGVPCGAIKTVGEVCTDPALLARGILKDLPHPTAGQVRVFDTPIRLSATPGGAEAAPPLLGQHTFEVLTELAAVTPLAIEVMTTKGTLRCAANVSRVSDGANNERHDRIDTQGGD
jgi:crotonobetainyl-CoA:carnitine CoA-transferase CaiB-like acyl-CoA transferase